MNCDTTPNVRWPLRINIPCLLSDESSNLSSYKSHNWNDSLQETVWEKESMLEFKHSLFGGGGSIMLINLQHDLYVCAYRRDMHDFIKFLFKCLWMVVPRCFTTSTLHEKKKSYKIARRKWGKTKGNFKSIFDWLKYFSPSIQIFVKELF